jgi:chromate reductase
MKILAFGASTSRKSINKILATYAAALVPGAAVEILDLNDYEMPLYSIDQEAVLGKPAPAQHFLAAIARSDALIISFAEHNGTYAAAYKSLFDWCSRSEQKVFQGKPAVFLSTSPGARGAASVLAAAVQSAPYFGAVVKASLSIPSFFDQFDLSTGTFKDPAMKEKLREVVATLC